MADYKIAPNGMIIRQSDGAWISPDPRNSDYVAYQLWLSQGNTPDPQFTLDQIKTNQINLLRQACALQIVQDTPSSATGTQYWYPMDQTSQMNMIASVTHAMLVGPSAIWRTPFWCRDVAGNWAFLQHTQTQIQQVGTDLKAAVVAAQTKLANLQAQVLAAADAAAVAAITW